MREHDAVPCAELLFRHGLDEAGKSILLRHHIDCDDPMGFRRLLAPRAAQRKLMELLRRHGGQTTLDPTDSFRAACAAGDEALARRHLDATPGLLDSLPDAGRSAIVGEAAAGNTAGVRTMLDVGFDANTKGKTWNETPERSCAPPLLPGNLELVRFLLGRGARFDRSNGEGLSALDHAMRRGHREVAELLRHEPG